MADILDYLDWRGDLTFLQAPFNEVDNLLCSYISYVKMELPLKKEQMTLKEFCDSFFEFHTMEELEKSKSVVRLAPIVMRKMAGTKRFGNCLVSDYVSHYNEETKKQFGAVTLRITDDVYYVSYRGTDDALLGWYEDLCLSFQIIPAQREAKLYLEKILRKYDGKLYVGGHSKGGNLAVYAAMNIDEEKQKRLLNVYCNDGPGFYCDYRAHEGFLRIKDRILSFSPKACVVGGLLDVAWKTKLVETKKKEVYAHDMISWEVMGDHLIPASDYTDDSILLRNSIHKWLDTLQTSERIETADALYHMFLEADIKYLTDLDEKKVTKLWRILEKMRQSPKAKEAMYAIVKAVVSQKWQMTFHKDGQ